MLNAIIRFSVRNKLVIGLITLAWIIWGLIELFRLPVDALPDITSNQVQVITVSPTLGSLEVERLITFPIEQASSNIPGIKEIRSISRFGLSVVTIVFDDDQDVFLNWLLLQRAWEKYISMLFVPRKDLKINMI